MNKKVLPTHYIDNPAALAQFCNALSTHSWLAVDTEFIREKSYYPKLCLIQIGTADSLACIDVLALGDLTPLLDIFSNPACVKVFHAAGQDLETFYHLNNRIPQPIFDTQLAAAFLGYGEQIGYANLVKTLLDVQLDKTHTRTDWARRPLTSGQIDYALDDVRYLCDIYPKLRQTLLERQRLSWLEEDFKALAQPARYRPNPEQAWQRVKSVNKLKGVRLNVLKHLAAWREHEAMSQDKPRKWILSDDHLTLLAQNPPKDTEQLMQLRDFNSGLIDRYAVVLLALIEKATQEPKSVWPVLKIGKKPPLQQEAVADLVTAVIRIKAAEHAISPQLLATRDDIHRVLHGDQDIPLLQGWRLQLAGQAVLDVLNEQTQLACVDHEAKLISKEKL